MMTQKKKDFDCIEIKRVAQSKIYDAIKQMTPEEEIAYFRKSIGSSNLSKWWSSIPSRSEVHETH